MKTNLQRTNGAYPRSTQYLHIIDNNHNIFIANNYIRVYYIKHLLDYFKINIFCTYFTFYKEKNALDLMYLGINHLFQMNFFSLQICYKLF